jgi:glycosyltransferase involved in cell wall biosynthesis
MPGYTSGMGYIGNCLPVEMAKLGHDVHIVTSKGKTYFNYPIYKKSYEPMWGSPIVNEPFKVENGVSIHRLDHKLILNTVYLKKLKQKLLEIKPDIVHCFDVAQPYILQAIINKGLIGYKVFILNHYLLSVVPVKLLSPGINLLKLKWFLLKYLPGKYIASKSEKCYCGAPDAIDVAVRFMGVPKEKCVLAELGVDTDKFNVVNEYEEKLHLKNLKEDLGFNDSDIICLYTGRFAPDKNPLLLAQALEMISPEMGFKGLFIGGGEQKDEIIKIECCKILPFMSHEQLAKYYQMADIGVWPTQESTSMIDAAACGLPIIVNDTIQTLERVDGNGLMYKLGDVEDLKEKLLVLADPVLRKKLGKFGRDKIVSLFSWSSIAKKRETDYFQSLK